MTSLNLYGRSLTMKRLFPTIAILAIISVLAITGCATDRTPPPSGDAFGVSAENVQEGILLTFENIPAKADRMFINIMNADTANIEDHFFNASANIMNTEFDQVRQTSTVLFPFGRSGDTYFIWVHVEELTGEGPTRELADMIIAETTITAGNDVVHIVNDITLELNDDQISVTLLQEPVFSAVVEFASPRYTFIALPRGELAGISHGGDTDELTWTWDVYEMADWLRTNEGIEVNELGSVPAYIEAHSNLIHDNLRWRVYFARTRQFTIYF